MIGGQFCLFLWRNAITFPSSRSSGCAALRTNQWSIYPPGAQETVQAGARYFFISKGTQIHAGVIFLLTFYCMMNLDF